MEEIEILRKGGNYGWPYYEATHLTTTNYPDPARQAPASCGLRDGPPAWEYPHSSSGADPKFSGLDVNGSLVYHGSRIAALTNAYLLRLRRRREYLGVASTNE